MCSKHAIPLKHKYIQLFPVNYTKMLIKITLSVPWSKQSFLWFHQSMQSLIRPFLFSSKQDHTTSPGLLLINEDRKYERTSFCLDWLQLAMHTAIFNIICKAIRRTPGGLKDAISCSTWNQHAAT